MSTNQKSNKLSNDKIFGNNNQVNNIINYQDDPKYLLDLLKSYREQSNMEKELSKRKTETENYLLHAHIQTLTSENEFLHNQINELQKIICRKNKYISDLLGNRKTN